MRPFSYPDISRFFLTPQAIEGAAAVGGHTFFGVRLSASTRALMEAVIWTVGLIAVGSADPTALSVIDLCLFKAIGLPRCPGCGLGHAMGYLFRGEWLLAIQTHWFSPVVLGVLIARISTQMRRAFSSSSLP